MLNKSFRAKARKGEVKHPPNGFCLVVLAGKAGKARLGGWFAVQRLRRSFAHHDSYVIGRNNAVELSWNATGKAEQRNIDERSDATDAQ
jgi:hypothetical protein